MSSNPLNELKRRLDDDTTPLPKRLRLAKNVIHSDHFPAAPKERIVAEWLEGITERNGLASKDIRHVISWLQFADELTNDLKCRLIKVVSHYLHSNPLNNEDIHYIINFLDNEKISATLQNQIDDYLFIIITLLQNLRNNGKDVLIQKIFTNLTKYYKECKKKLKFIIKLLDGENLETIFTYLDSENRNTVLNVCQNILFPMTKKSFFVNFLQHIIKNDNIDKFIADKSENVQSVIKILSAFFMFPKGRTSKDQKFLIDFVDTFVNSFRNEGQILFAFYIMAVSSLNIRQNYLNPEMIIPSITFKENDDKIKRNIFLKMLNTLIENEVDISIKLTDISERTKLEIKKNFMSFLQATMLGCLKLEHKTDKISLQIINSAIKLDPSIIEQKLDVILPQIMISKKNSNVKDTYIEMLNCLIETLFKLSRGTLFVEKILPSIKLKLEVLNVEQFELRQKSIDNMDNEKSKIITVDDILPQECIEMYGKWTSELMFRQNNGLLLSLQKDFEENCLMMLEEGCASPSIIILTEVLSAILSSFFKYSKMADHTVPQQISEEFWMSFQMFGEVCLKKFGECILKLNYSPSLLLSFLKLCLSYSKLKLLNLKYGNIKMKETNESTEMTDCGIMLPCLNREQWVALSEMIQEEEAIIIWDNILLVKLMFTQVLKLKNSEIDQDESEILTKTNIIKQLSQYSEVISSDTYFTRELFNNLDQNQAKQLAKSLVKSFVSGNNCDVFKNVSISKNRILLNALVLEASKCIMKCFDNSNTLTKAMNKSNFDIESFLQSINVRDYFNDFIMNENEEENIIKYIDILKDVPIYNLEENYRLTTIFVLLTVKKCCQTKKLRRSIDSIILSTYELSPKYPDLYKIFPVDFIFSFQDCTILNLLKLSLKTSNNMLIIKFILELTVRKVKTNNEILKELVEILLSTQNSKKSSENIEYFSDIVFQIQCIILPIIAKEKRAITTSAFRTILANLQDKLHQAMLDAFMRIDFTKIDSSDETGNTDDSLVTSDRSMATLNAIGAYSLTLLKYCEMTDVEELKKLDCLWSGLEYFVQNAIKAVKNPDTKYQHIETSIQLLNIVLRYIKKLESHIMFKKKDKLFKQIWHSIKKRLLLIFDNTSKKRLNTGLLENISVTLKFLAELSSVDCFVTFFLGKITDLIVLKKPEKILKDETTTNLHLTSHQTAKYLLQNCLKANIIAHKRIGITKQIYKLCKNLKDWIKLHFESEIDMQESKLNNINNDDSEVNLTAVKVDDAICNLLRIDLDMIAEVILAAKKTTIDHKFIGAIFELQHLIQYILGRNVLNIRSEITWQSFFTLHEGAITVLNNLLLSREEILEDRWPCYMQCYNVLIQCACERARLLEIKDRNIEQKLAETAHSIEKLTQSICKRKTHVSRIAAYAVADICIWVEKYGPPKLVRQHLENSIALLIQASDSTYSMAFLKRSLAGTVGQMTMSNMYSMYKRYHKYVGNA